MKRIILLTVFACMASFTSFAANLDEIYRKSYLFSRDSHVKIDFTMDIHMSTGDKSRGMEVYYQEDHEGRKILAQITSPGFLRNMKYLVHHDREGGESRWMKSSRGVSRITGGGQDEPLFGSDFSVADISAVILEYDSIRLVNEDPVLGRRVFAIELNLRDSRVYTKKVLYIDKETFMVLKAEFFDARGVLMKEYELLEWEESSDGLVPQVCAMSNPRENTHTTLTVESFDIRDSFPGRIFNRGNL